MCDLIRVWSYTIPWWTLKVGGELIGETAFRGVLFSRFQQPDMKKGIKFRILDLILVFKKSEHIKNF